MKLIVLTTYVVVHQSKHRIPWGVHCSFDIFDFPVELSQSMYTDINDDIDVENITR